MDKRKEANMRVKERITTALLRLLENKSISEVSVSEIIAGAGVARASFYRNYATKESVLTTLISDVLEEFRKDLQSDGGISILTRTYAKVLSSSADMEIKSLICTVLGMDRFCWKCSISFMKQSPGRCRISPWSGISYTYTLDRFTIPL